MFPVVIEAVRVPRIGAAAQTRHQNRHPRTLGPNGHRKRRGSRGGRPVNFDSETYKGRNTVERSFSLFKQWRAIATRYDKLALTYRAGVMLYAVVIWVRQ